jgi:hypothetical protein
VKEGSTEEVKRQTEGGETLFYQFQHPIGSVVSRLGETQRSEIGIMEWSKGKG